MGLRDIARRILVAEDHDEPDGTIDIESRRNDPVYTDTRDQADPKRGNA